MHVLCAAEEREDREIVGRSAEEGGRTSPHLPARPSLELPPKSTLDLAALQAKLEEETTRARDAMRQRLHLRKRRRETMTAAKAHL